MNSQNISFLFVCLCVWWHLIRANIMFASLKMKWFFCKFNYYLDYEPPSYRFNCIVRKRWERKRIRIQIHGTPIDVVLFVLLDIQNSNGNRCIHFIDCSMYIWIIECSQFAMNLIRYTELLLFNGNDENDSRNLPHFYFSLLLPIDISFVQEPWSNEIKTKSKPKIFGEKWEMFTYSTNDLNEMKRKRNRFKNCLRVSLHAYGTRSGLSLSLSLFQSNHHYYSYHVRWPCFCF